mgnify:CR=1 FL=1
MTQNEMILKYLEEKGSITTYESYTELFITRLSARIWDLKHKYDCNFEEEWITKKNRYGKVCTFKKYTLKKEEEKGNEK